MSTIEKKIYSEITVPGNNRIETITSKTSYRGMSTVNPDNVTFSLYDISLIKQDLINHFHIRQGEKLSNPEFGTIIWDALFEPLTESLKEAITQNVTKIINSDPRTNVNSILIDQYEKGIQIECTITYLPFNISETLRMRFDEDAGFLKS
jgi:phage baseplate assembly protein W|tara:strand:+ start:1812 stop:2261 length:450 start_codon:yes stop_codon:yes gene_type:complete